MEIFTILIILITTIAGLISGYIEYGNFIKEIKNEKRKRNIRKDKEKD